MVPLNTAATTWCITGSHQQGDCGTGCTTGATIHINVTQSGATSWPKQDEVPKPRPWWHEVSARKCRRDRRRRKAF